MRVLRWIPIVVFLLAGAGFARDLPQIRESGVIRHIGVPYANFITGSGDGLDAELVQRFAQHLGVRYEYVNSSWPLVIGDLTGKTVEADGSGVRIVGQVPEKGDLIASGLTILEWRKQIVVFSVPTFPTQVWIVANAQSRIRPIIPSGDLESDIRSVKSKLPELTVLGKSATCLDPTLYAIADTGARVRYFEHGLNDLAPAVIKGEADVTLLDVPDALIALEKWPGKIKVIGPVSAHQQMGVAFARTSPQLLDAFNRFFLECKADGTYEALVRKYYPGVFDHFSGFFR